MSKVVAVVRVTHEHKAAPRGRDCCIERSTIASRRHVHDPRAVRRRDRLRAVGGTVVPYNHFAGDSVLP